MVKQTPAALLDAKFAALADATRRSLLARLRQGPASVTTLAEPFLDDMTLPAVTKHLKVLEKARLITRTRDAQFRPCHLDEAALRDVDNWLEPFRQMWEAQLDRLGEYLEQKQRDKTRTTSRKTSQS